MPRKRLPAAIVRTAADSIEPAARPQLPVKNEDPIPYVIPTVQAMLNDIKVVVGEELRQIRNAQREAPGIPVDATGQRIRNLAATVATIQETTAKANDEDLTAYTPAQLAAALREEADRIEGAGDDE